MFDFRKTHRSNNSGIILVFGLLALFGGCSAGPAYVKPATQVPPAYKEAANWKEAQPQENIARGAWWKIYKDEVLNSLEGQVDISNQNIAAAEAQFQESRALVRSAKAAYFPTISVAGQSVQTSTGAFRNTVTNNTANANFAWELDVWGKVRRNVESSKANVQATAADLEALRLSVHATLAQEYFLLRSLDMQKQIVDETIEGYRRFLEMTRNRYDSGVASKADVLAADTQYKTTYAQGIDIGIQRAQTEHAIAILIGKLPSLFSLSVSSAGLNVPAVPLGLPSELLERRPDIAAAERRVKAANAQIGVAKAAYFPAITLNGTGQSVSQDLATLFSVPNQVWLYGPGFAETLFAGGARRAQVAQAKAAYRASVANYKQTILTGFQEVEDSLSAIRILEEEAAAQDEAVRAADQSLTISTNQYEEGTLSALNVITAQVADLANRKTAVNIQYGRLSASVQLIKALGGGWDVSMLPYAKAKKQPVK